MRLYCRNSTAMSYGLSVVATSFGFVKILKLLIVIDHIALASLDRESSCL